MTAVDPFGNVHQVHRPLCLILQHGCRGQVGMGRGVHAKRGKALVVPVVVCVLPHGRHVRVGVVAHGEGLCCHGRVGRRHGLVPAAHAVHGVGRGVLVAARGHRGRGVDVAHHGPVAGGEHRGRCECLLQLLLLLPVLGSPILEPHLKR